MKINKLKFTPVQNTHYFGVVIDKFLSWGVHLNNLCKKLSQTNGFLSKLCHCVPQKTRISVCLSLFDSFRLYDSLA